MVPGVRATSCSLKALVPALCLLLAVTAGAEELVEREFEESGDLVLNPDCGWVAYNYEDGYNLRKRAAGGKEPFRFASVVYTRHPSRSWEDENGSFQNSAPLKLLEVWMANRRHVAFRVYANGLMDLPPRLREHAKTFTYSQGGKTRRRLVYWDDAYVGEHRRLIRFLGERLGGSPHLAFVDIGGVGNSGGEWFLDPHDAFVRAGLDDDTFFELVKAFVEMYREAFPDIRLFISYDCITLAGGRRQDVVALLEQHRIGIRDDDLGSWPYPRPAPPRRGWPLPTLWQKMPVLFECGGTGGGVYGLVKQGKDPRAVLNWAFRLCPPTYVNMGGSETASEKACAELADVLTDYGRKLGYRFVLLRAVCPSTLRKGEAGELRMIWANRGVAPCYADREIEVALFDAGGELVSSSAARPVPATTEWMPGTELQVRVPLSLANGVPTGAYVLKVGMLLGDAREPGRHVAVATEGADEDGRYTVGIIKVAD